MDLDGDGVPGSAYILYLDLHFGPQKGQKSVKSSIMAAQGPWFGLKMILIDFISGSDIY